MKDNYTLKERLLNLCQKIYGPKRISEESINIGKDTDQIIEFARKNRLAHYLALEYSKSFKEDKNRIDIWNSLNFEYSHYKRNLKNSLGEIKDVLGAEQFMVIKTFSIFPHLTGDLDVVVKDLKIAKELTKKISNKKNLLPVDITTQVSWRGADAVSDDFVWNNRQRFTFEGIDFFIPNSMLDTIIRIAHIPFELAHIKLGELLHLYRQASSFDWKILENEARLMNWPKTFKKMSDILEILHCELFKTPLFEKDITPISYIGNIKFPFRLPVSILAGGIVEKRTWKKIFGARFIIKDWIAEWVQENIF